MGRTAALLERFAELPALASPHLPAVQSAALLLRMCGCGQATHLLRSSPPTRVQEAARAYDHALLQTYEKLASLDPLMHEQKE